MPAGSYVKRMPWGRQKPPLGYGIDWSYPLAKNILAAWTFNQNSGTLVNDLTGRYDVSFADGVASPTWTNNGVATQDDYFKQLSFGNSPFNFATGQKFTVAFICSVTNYLDRYICSTKGTSNTGWGVFLSSTTYKISYVQNGVAVYQGNGVNTLDRFMGVVSCGASNAGIYRNGKSEVSLSRGNMTSSNYFQICATNNANALKGALYYLIIWKDRELSVDDNTQLYAEPYCFIEGWNYGRSYSIPSSAFINSSFWYQNPIMEAI